MTYSVKYKTKYSWFWKKLTDIKGDLIASDVPNMRIFIKNDETRIEIPLDGTEFVFCPKRFITIKQKMEQEAGQSIPLKG